MLELGTKVYAWDFNREQMEVCPISKEPLIGVIDEVDDERHEYVIKNILDGKFYRHKMDCIYPIGTGPAIKKLSDEGLLPYFDRV